MSRGHAAAGLRAGSGEDLVTAVRRVLTLAASWVRRLCLEAGSGRVSAGESRSSAADFDGIDVLAGLRVAARGVGEAWSWLSWRWRRLVVRRKRLLVVVLLVLMAAGLRWSSPLHLWAEGTVLMGGPRMWGQIVVRPPIGPGAVRRASVKLVPAGPGGGFTGVLIAFSSAGPSVVAPAVDHAGRWRASEVAPGWRYAVVVEAEGCRPSLAGVVDTGWIRSVRVDHWMRSCMHRDMKVAPRLVLRPPPHLAAGMADAGR